MTNIASVFKSEIGRLARKEVKAEVAPLKKAVSQYRSSIAALKRQVQELERQLRRKSRSTGSASSADKGGEEDGGVRLRFRAGGLVSHRRKLDLSAEDYGALVGVSGQSIYKWEQGEVRPRAAQLQALAGVRGIGKREALARLEQLAAAAARQKPARKRKA